MTASAKALICHVVETVVRRWLSESLVGGGLCGRCQPDQAYASRQKGVGSHNEKPLICEPKDESMRGGLAGSRPCSERRVVERRIALQ